MNTWIMRITIVVFGVDELTVTLTLGRHSWGWVG